MMRKRSANKPSNFAEPRNTKAPLVRGFRLNLGGKPGIRTLGTLLTFAGFQDRYAKSSGLVPWRPLAFLYSQLPTKLQAAFYRGCGFGLGTVFAPLCPSVVLYQIPCFTRYFAPFPTQNQLCQNQTFPAFSKKSMKTIWPSTMENDVCQADSAPPFCFSASYTSYKPWNHYQPCDITTTPIRRSCA